MKIGLLTAVTGFAKVIYTFFAVMLITLAGNILYASEVHEAAIKGDVEQVKSLIALGITVNERDDQGVTPLIYASANGKDDLVNYLISQGADVNISLENGITALSMAAKYDKKRIVSILLNNGANVNGVGESIPLFQATIMGHKDVVELLLKKGANVNAKDKSGNSALHYAVRDESKKELVDLLIKSGADVNAKGFAENIPLTVAASRGYKAITQLLIRGGADVNLSIKGSPPRTPLLFAVWNKYMDKERYSSVIKLLIENGAKDDWLSAVPGFDPYNFSPLNLSVNDRGTVMVGNMPFMLGRHYADRPWKKPNKSDSSTSGTDFFSWEDKTKKDMVTITVIEDENGNSTLGNVLPPAFIGKGGIIYHDGITSIAKNGPFVKINIRWNNAPDKGKVSIKRKEKLTTLRPDNDGFSMYLLKNVDQNEPITVSFLDKDKHVLDTIDFDCVIRGATQDSVSVDLKK